MECVIMIGLPAAGKTSLYRERFAATHVVVSKDLWTKGTKSDARLLCEVGESLASGRSVVVDNTNVTKQDRAALIAAARRHGARVIGFFFDVTTRQAIARNAERTGAARVPKVAIFTVAKRLEPPSVHEGFDQLFRVEITPARTFAIHELPAGT